MCLVHLTFKVSGLARLYARGPLERRVMHLLDDATYHLLPINTGNSTRISSRALDPPGISDFSFPISNRAKTTCRPFFQPSPRTSPADDFHLSCRYCPEASRCRFSMYSPSFGCTVLRDCGIRHVISRFGYRQLMRDKA